MEHRWEHVSFGEVTATDDRPGAKPRVLKAHLFRCRCGEELYSDRDFGQDPRKPPCPSRS